MASIKYYLESAKAEDVFKADYDKVCDNLKAIVDFNLREETHTADSLTVVGFQKSFWKGKKEAFYLYIEYIDDFILGMPDDLKSEYPENSEFLVGFEFRSKYGSISVKDDDFNPIHNLPKQLISYGILMDKLKRMHDIYMQEATSRLFSLSGMIALKQASKASGAISLLDKVTGRVTVMT